MLSSGNGEDRGSSPAGRLYRYIIWYELSVRTAESYKYIPHRRESAQGDDSRLRFGNRFDTMISLARKWLSNICQDHVDPQTRNSASKASKGGLLPDNAGTILNRFVPCHIVLWPSTIVDHLDFRANA